jgi:hypothetical protein
MTDKPEVLIEEVESKLEEARRSKRLEKFRELDKKIDEISRRRRMQGFKKASEN